MLLKVHDKPQREWIGTMKRTPAPRTRSTFDTMSMYSTVTTSRDLREQIVLACTAAYSRSHVCGGFGNWHAQGYIWQETDWPFQTHGKLFVLWLCSKLSN